MIQFSKSSEVNALDPSPLLGRLCFAVSVRAWRPPRAVGGAIPSPSSPSAALISMGPPAAAPSILHQSLLCVCCCFHRALAMDRIVSALMFLGLCVAVACAATLPQDYWKEVLPNTPMPGAVRDQLIPADAEELSSASPFVFISNQLAATKDEIRNEANADIFFLEKDLYPGAKRMLHFTRRAPAAAFVPRPVADAIPFSSEYFPHILTSFSIEPNSPKAEAIKKTLQSCDDAAEAGEAKRCVTSLESMVDFATSSLGTHKVLALSTEGAKKRQFYTVAPSGVQRLSTGGKLAACHTEPYLLLNEQRGDRPESTQGDYPRLRLPYKRTKESLAEGLIVGIIRGPYSGSIVGGGYQYQYPYAVFYCHAAATTIRAYMVSLVGEDGGRATAVAVCHTNTSGWHPKHLAFLVLKVKPGAVPVCHFLPQDNVIWMPRQ
ncbi:hypothetical protein Taro_039711 [Colocasia esculenta]|uniref:BURP domain-containing protein n=1 Tax=Colocasia esculenta TaxID=4460 RepID=A0A843WWH3_COLES|nr:hypothetical protein [Colocasia esculenta]